MCGIAGSVGDPDGSAVSLQLARLGHRGPDASGTFSAGRGHIGQTRLAVIDLDTGDPPITNEDRSVGVVLNGEIYNFSSLREALLQRGHTLRTRGDTEVIVHLFEDLSPVEVARRLDGMFAFAVWDGRRLVLGRDRLGKKPLYYCHQGSVLVFASELKGLLAHPSVSRSLYEPAIDAYLTFGYVPTPYTFFEGVYSVPPAHVAVFDSETAQLSFERYWSLPQACDLAEVDHVFARDKISVLRDLLARAVRKRMVADVPMGAFLSGGVDSSTVVALMAESSTHPVSTFTIGFEDFDGFDERPYARAVSQHLGTDHHEFVVQPDAAALVEELVEVHDQPFGDSSALPTYLLCQMTRRHVTVALCGDGGDEVFAGYERLAAAVHVSRLSRVPASLRGAAEKALSATPLSRWSRSASLLRFFRRTGMQPQQALRSWASYVPDEWAERLRPGSSTWAIDDYDRLWEETPRLSLLGRLQAQTINTYLLDDLLVKVDRTSMAHALEVRSPLLDPDLVTFGVTLPARLKVRGLSLKRILKQAMADRLPPQIIQRGKRGFAVPLDRWFRNDLRPLIHGTLGGSDARLYRYLKADAINEMLCEHDRGPANHGQALWTLLTLELFLRREGW